MDNNSIPLRDRLPWCPKVSRRERKRLVAKSVQRERDLFKMLMTDPFVVGDD